MNNITRIIFIISKLTERAYTVLQLEEKLLDEFKTFQGRQDKQIYKDLKKLEKLGFIISRSNRKKDSGALLKIEKTPLKLNLTDEERELINELFNSYANNQSQLVSLFDNLNNLFNLDLENIIYRENLVEFENKEIYPEIKKKLAKAKSEKKKVCFKYKPIGKEIKTYYGFPYKIEKDEKKIERVILFNEYFHNYCEYNLDRICSIPDILEREIFPGEFPSYFCRFKLYLPVSCSYHRLSGESIESTDDEEGSIIISSRYFTAFRLIQKLLKYGDNAEILTPKEARAEMTERVLKMSKLYS